MRRSLQERLLSNLGSKDPTTGCIEWLGCCYRGYGRITVKNKSVRAHRVAYELTNGPIPEGFKVLHTCDNPPCCNPDHLFLGTSANNSADMVAKGRATQSPPRGSRNSNAKFTEKDVKDIRDRLNQGEQLKPIANLYGVSVPTIHSIKTRKTWSHI